MLWSSTLSLPRPQTRQALVEADYALIPAPPEFMAVTAIEQMLATRRRSSSHREPVPDWLGVVPTMYTRSWPEHHAFLEQMRETWALRVPA